MTLAVPPPPPSCDAARLLRLGDFLVPGVYRVHSCFSEIINLSYNGNLISVTSSLPEMGPSQIRAEGIPLESITEVEVSENEIRFDNLVLSRDAVPEFSSRPELGVGKWGCVAASARASTADILRGASEHSLTFLLSESRAADLPGWEGKMRAQQRLGAQRLLGGNLASGARALAGCGIGLTPGGDDFLAGFLAALAIVELSGARGTLEERREVLEHSRETGLLSRHFMGCAAEGRFFEGLKLWVESCWRREDAGAHGAARRLARVGETSGTDMLVGFLWGLKREENL